MQLIKRKKIFENAGQLFHPESAHAYYDVDELTKERKQKPKIVEDDFAQYEEV